MKKLIEEEIVETGENEVLHETREQEYKDEENKGIMSEIAEKENKLEDE